jgi:carbon-monoxide dehydrogenase large subunit
MPRGEDARLLTGAGQYANDFSLPGQAYAYLVRSPDSHAKIVKIDVALAIGGPGVIAVLTGSDAAGDGLKPIPHSPVPTNPHEVPLRNRDGSGFFIGISGSATAPARNSSWSPGRRNASAGRSNGFANGVKHF